MSALPEATRERIPHLLSAGMSKWAISRVVPVNRRAGYITGNLLRVTKGVQKIHGSGEKKKDTKD